MRKLTLTANGLPRTVIANPKTTLMDVVRKQMLLTGTKDGCEDGHCGACAVLVNGKYTLACITKSVGSARRALSSHPMRCFRKTPTPPAKKSGPGSRSGTTSAAATGIFPMWMPSSTRPK